MQYTVLYAVQYTVKYTVQYTVQYATKKFPSVSTHVVVFIKEWWREY